MPTLSMAMIVPKVINKLLGRTRQPNWFVFQNYDRLQENRNVLFNFHCAQIVSSISSIGHRQYDYIKYALGDITGYINRTVADFVL